MGGIRTRGKRGARVAAALAALLVPLAPFAARAGGTFAVHYGAPLRGRRVLPHGRSGCGGDAERSG